MAPPNLDRRRAAERRVLADRRDGDRRQPDAPPLVLVTSDRRRRRDRRAGIERRSGPDRRLPLQNASDQIRRAIDLVARVAEIGEMGEEELRALDTAIVRLRFAQARIEEGKT